MMSRHTSNPIRSASASGPMGWFMPSFMTESIAAAVPTPSITQKMASLTIGINTLLDTNPGKSFTSTGVFPRDSASCAVVL